MLLTLFVGTVARAADVTDVLNQSVTGITTTTYTDFSGIVLISGASYAGQCAGGNASIQLRSRNENSGVVTTASPGKLKRVAVTWNSATTEGRTLNVYGANAPYTSATQLFSEGEQGTLLGTIVYGQTTELEVSGDYAYVGVCSVSGALYLTELCVTWDVEDDTDIKQQQLDEAKAELTSLLEDVSAFLASAHMYAPVKKALAQAVAQAQTVLESSTDIDEVWTIIGTLRNAYYSAQNSASDYVKLADYIDYTQQLLDQYGPMFSDEVKTKITTTISGLQAAYQYGSLTGEQIDQVWPTLQETTRDELTKFLDPYIQKAEALMAEGLADEVHSNLSSANETIKGILTWSYYDIDNINYIKDCLVQLNSAMEAAAANWAEMPILRQAYEQLGGKDGALTDWQFETKPYSVPGVGFENGSATYISLNGKELTGNFPSAFLLLPKLTGLYLDYNQLSGDVAEALADMIAAKQTSSLKYLDIDGNRLSGNLGLFGVICPQIEYLKANHNKFEDCIPALPSTATTQEWQHQEMERTLDFTLGEDALETILQQLPSLLTYDPSATDGLATRLAFQFWQDDCELYLYYQDGEFSLSSNNIPFKGKNGETLTATCYSGYASGSTFKVCLHFAEGDANFNGKVDITDLQMVVNYIFNEWNSTFNFTAANLYEDEIINVQDVVRMVDVLLAADEPAGVRKLAHMRAHNNKEAGADAHLYWRGNELVLETTVPVASADIRFSGDGMLNWNLQQMGFTVTEKRSSEAGHCIVYSLAGAEIPVGETVIATRNGGQVDMTMVRLANKQAQPVAVSLSAPAVTSVSQLLAEEEAWTLYAPNGAVVVQGRGNAMLRAARNGLAAGVYILRSPSNRTRKITIK